MRTDSIVKIVKGRKNPIAKMEYHERLFYSYILATIHEEANTLFIREENGWITLYCFKDPYDAESCKRLFEIPVKHAEQLLPFASSLSRDEYFCGRIKNIHGYFLIDLKGELVHCLIENYCLSEGKEEFHMGFGLIYDTKVVPEIARSIIADCASRGLYRED